MTNEELKRNTHWQIWGNTTTQIHRKVNVFVQTQVKKQVYGLLRSQIGSLVSRPTHINIQDTKDQIRDSNNNNNNNKKQI